MHEFKCDRFLTNPLLLQELKSTSHIGPDICQIEKVFSSFVHNMDQTVVTRVESEQVVETHAASVSAVLDCSDCETTYMHRKAADGKGMITWQY